MERKSFVIKRKATILKAAIAIILILSCMIPVLTSCDDDDEDDGVSEVVVVTAEELLDAMVAAIESDEDDGDYEAMLSAMVAAIESDEDDGDYEVVVVTAEELLSAMVAAIESDEDDGDYEVVVVTAQELLDTMVAAVTMAPPVVVITIGGWLTTDIHDVVDDVVEDEIGYKLKIDDSWVRWWNAPTPATVSFGEDLIEDDLDRCVVGDPEGQSVLIIGKSAGGVQAWQMLKHQWTYFNDFDRIALVLVDPHGDATVDGCFLCPYGEDKDLTWVTNWSENTDFMRVYHVFQQQYFPEGADFPSSHVYESKCLTGLYVNHYAITSHSVTKDLIEEAFYFALGEEDISWEEETETMIWTMIEAAINLVIREATD